MREAEAEGFWPGLHRETLSQKQNQTPKVLAPAQPWFWTAVEPGSLSDMETEEGSALKVLLKEQLKEKPQRMKCKSGFLQRRQLL